MMSQCYLTHFEGGVVRLESLPIVETERQRLIAYANQREMPERTR
jgi:hypothetical protein